MQGMKSGINLTRSSDDDMTTSTLEFDTEVVSKFMESKQGEGCLRGEWRHDKSASSAYWDPRGRQIVSTSYDDTIRCKHWSCFGEADIPKVFAQCGTSSRISSTHPIPSQP